MEWEKKAYPHKEDEEGYFDPINGCKLINSGNSYFNWNKCTFPPPIKWRANYSDKPTHVCLMTRAGDHRQQRVMKQKRRRRRIWSDFNWEWNKWHPSTRDCLFDLLTFTIQVSSVYRQYTSSPFCINCMVTRYAEEEKRSAENFAVRSIGKVIMEGKDIQLILSRHITWQLSILFFISSLCSCSSHRINVMQI